MEKATEDDKQKLREGKVSISKVYQDIVDADKPTDKKPVVAQPESERDLQNRLALLALLERLERDELFCPSCGGKMLECSKCHKTLKSLLQSATSQKKDL
jgi:uncharacterized protein with PIN domain